VFFYYQLFPKSIFKFAARGNSTLLISVCPFATLKEQVLTASFQQGDEEYQLQENTKFTSQIS